MQGNKFMITSEAYFDLYSCEYLVYTSDIERVGELLYSRTPAEVVYVDPPNRYAGEVA
jgi:hypothetical protein